MTQEEHEVEAARFLRWHFETGAPRSDLAKNLATWTTDRNIKHADAFRISHLAMAALHDNEADVKAWIRRTIPSGQPELDQMRRENHGEPPF